MFIVIVTSSFEVEVVENVKNCKICRKQTLKDGVDHFFLSTIPSLGTVHTSKRKKKES